MAVLNRADWLMSSIGSGNGTVMMLLTTQVLFEESI
jgi:hypothetical protein